MMRILTLLLILASACGYKKPQEVQDDNLDLRERRNLYFNLTAQVPDEYGFVHSVGDGLLFTCLRYWAGDAKINPFAAIGDDGRPVRHPTLLKTVPDKDRSATPFSKDMFVGLLYCFDTLAKTDRAKFAELTQRVAAYGKANDWDLCGPAPEYKISTIDRLSRCKMSSVLVGTLYEMMAQNGVGCDDYCASKRKAVQIPNPVVIGFERHLEILLTALRGKLFNGVTSGQLFVLRYAAESEPNNALYEAVRAKYDNGNFDKARGLLLTAKRFSPDRPPGPADYCTEYLWQRDEFVSREYTAGNDGCISYFTAYDKLISECDLVPEETYDRFVYNEDWAPCYSEKKYHSATDWLVAAKFIIGD